MLHTRRTHHDACLRSSNHDNARVTHAVVAYELMNATEEGSPLFDKLFRHAEKSATTEKDGGGD